MTAGTGAFAGQVVVVTGAAAGIGLGIARAFHAVGASVVLADFREDALGRAQASLGDEGADRLAFIPVDVRDAASVADLVAGAERAFGPVSVLVANAGVYPNSPVLEMAPEEWDAVMETNVRGVFLSCQAAARSMVAHDTRGRIVTISSGAHESGRRGAAHYCASKAGVVMFTKVLAMELGEHHINVNCVSPGLIEIRDESGAALNPISDEYRDSLTRSIPWGRVGQPDDIARAVLFLCTDDAEFITGAVLSVDGGSGTGRTHLPYSTPRT